MSNFLLYNEVESLIQTDVQLSLYELQNLMQIVLE